MAAAIGFVEVLIWITAAGQVLQNLNAWYLAVAYAGGFAAGNILGIWFEGKMAIGMELVRVISESGQIKLADRLREKSYQVVELEGTGDKSSPVEVIFIVEKRRKVASLLADIEAIDPNAYCTISDIKRHTMLAMSKVSSAESGIAGALKRK